MEAVFTPRLGVDVRMVPICDEDERSSTQAICAPSFIRGNGAVRNNNAATVLPLILMHPNEDERAHCVCPFGCNKLTMLPKGC